MNWLLNLLVLWICRVLGVVVLLCDFIILILNVVIVLFCGVVRIDVGGEEFFLFVLCWVDSVFV